MSLFGDQKNINYEINKRVLFIISKLDYDKTY